MLPTLHRLLRLILTITGFFAFFSGALVLAVFSLVWVPYTRLRGFDAARRSASSRAQLAAAFHLFHDYLRVVQVIDFNPRPLATELPTAPCVLIANHPTLIDVTAIIAAHRQTTCIVKGALFVMPIAGSLLRRSWHINNQSGAMAAAISVIIAGTHRLRAGLSVLIFPEGSRSPEGGLRPFKRGAFELACRTDVAVVPLFITCTPGVLAKQAPWYRVPKEVPKMRIVVLPTMLPKDWNNNSRAMAKDAHAGYLKLLRGEKFERWR